MDQIEDVSSGHQQPGIPASRFYVYAAWMIGAAGVFIVLITLCSPEQPTCDDAAQARDAGAEDRR